MGRSLDSSQVVGLDTSVFIYVIERHPQYLSRARAVLKSVVSGKQEAVFSVIGMIELLTGPKKLGRYDIAAEYREYILRISHLVVTDMDSEIVDLSSTLRATYNLNTPDAIHLATAIASGADRFITNDHIKKVKEIKVELLSQY